MHYRYAKNLHNRDEVHVRPGSRHGRVLGTPRVESKDVYVDVLLDSGEFIRNLHHRQLV